jgi:ATP-dependent Lhr-like helicase
VAFGLVTSDSFTGLRALLVPAKYKLRSTSERHHHKSLFNMDQAGRWSLLYESTPLIPSITKRENKGGVSADVPPLPSPLPQGERGHGNGGDTIELIARVLLRRYGVVFRKIAERENISPPWRELVRIYRTLEARGEIRGGRFVDGVWGEQFALPEAVTKLRAVKKEEKTGGLISISAADPLNLQGIITPGRRVTNFTANRILYRDGIPIAVNEGGEVEFLTEFEKSEKWKIQNALIQQHVSPKLRAYLGKGIG